MVAIISSTFSRPISGKDAAAWDTKHPKSITPKPHRPVVTRTKDGHRTIRAVRPNAGVAANYQKKIDALINEMTNSIQYWVKASYRRNEPEVSKLAQDSAADELRDAVNKLRRRWERRFDTAAQELAAYFAKGVTQRSDDELRKILKKAGISVEFRMTAAARDVLKAIVSENVSLIRSIPEQLLGSVEGAVMRSVVAGRDLGQLSSELQHSFGVTKRRAALIAIQQNNSATSAIQVVRFTELGIERGVWRHSHAGREPRVTHVANDGKEYDIKTGWFDPDPRVRKHIRPGELIHCRCFVTPVLPGF
jgi:uncharacterized protein with gpF-like domain